MNSPSTPLRTSAGKWLPLFALVLALHWVTSALGQSTTSYVLTNLWSIAPQTNTIIKWMSRANTWVYKKTDGKIGGKFLQGAPVALLTTTGRKTGLTRTTPLGFVHVPDTDTYFVSAGWYGKTDWYRNLRANPRVRVHHGRRTFACQARPISDDEAVPVIRRTVDRNPFALRLWERWTDQPLDGSDDSLRVVARAFPTVALQAPSGTP